MNVKIGCYFDEDGQPTDMGVSIEKGMRVQMFNNNDEVICSFDPEEIKALAAMVKEICE